MIDAHIISLKERRGKWLGQCVASVLEAIENAPFPITLSVLPAIVGNSNKAKKYGYAVGSNPYVVSIDDDDWVAPNFFSVVDPKLLEQKVPGIFVRETYVIEDRKAQSGERHKLAAVRRDIVEGLPLEDDPLRGEGNMVKRAVESEKGFVDLHEWVYFRRLR